MTLIAIVCIPRHELSNAEVGESRTRGHNVTLVYKIAIHLHVIPCIFGHVSYM